MVANAGRASRRHLSFCGRFPRRLLERRVLVLEARREVEALHLLVEARHRVVPRLGVGLESSLGDVSALEALVLLDRAFE